MNRLRKYLSRNMSDKHKLWAQVVYVHSPANRVLSWLTVRIFCDHVQPCGCVVRNEVGGFIDELEMCLNIIRYRSEKP